jgi:hypothetical protein
MGAYLWLNGATYVYQRVRTGHPGLGSSGRMNGQMGLRAATAPARKDESEAEAGERHAGGRAA